MRRTILSKWTPTRIIQDLFWRPGQFWDKLDEKPPWEKQMFLAFKAGWLPGAFLLWFLVLCLIAYFQLPAYYPDWFWGKVALNWSLEFWENMWWLFKSTWIGMGMFLFAGMLVQLLAYDANDIFLFDEHPFLFWVFLVSGILATTTKVPALYIYSLSFCYLISISFYTKVGYVSKMGDASLDASFFTYSFVLVFGGWILFGIVLLGLDDDGITFWGWLISGLVALFPCISGLILWNDVKEKNSETLQSIFLWLYAICLFTPFLIFFSMIEISLASKKVLLLYFGVSFFIWLALYFRWWSWVYHSLLLVFSGPSLAPLLKDPDLPVPPFCSTSRIRKAASMAPAETLAVGTYLINAKQWEKFGWKIIHLVEEEYTGVDELKKKLAFVREHLK